MTRKPTVLYGLMILIIMVIGICGFLALTFSKTQPDQKQRSFATPMVDVVDVKWSSVPLVVKTMGEVQPSQFVKIVPQVNGKIIFINPDLIPGGMIKKGEVLIRIDPSDYDLAIREAAAAVTQAQLTKEEQEGRRAAAGREMKLLDNQITLTDQGRRLASRETHLENALAQLDAAQSRLEQAQLARSRTVVRAPFDARVSAEFVDIGQVVSGQSVMTTLVASDKAWVQATLPVERLQWIDIPGLNADTGSSVVVRQKLAGNKEIIRRGKVLRFLPDQNQRGNLARLLIQVSDPFGETGPQKDSSVSENRTASLPLLVGSFVHVEIKGRTLQDLLALPRSALREDSQVWVYAKNGQLAFRSVELVWNDEDKIYIRGDLDSNEPVITSRLNNPVPGMKLRLNDQDKSSLEASLPSIEGTQQSAQPKAETKANHK